MAKLILETEYGMRVIRDDLPEDVKNDDILYKGDRTLENNTTKGKCKQIGQEINRITDRKPEKTRKVTSKTLTDEQIKTVNRQYFYGDNDEMLLSRAGYAFYYNQLQNGLDLCDADRYAKAFEENCIKNKIGNDESECKIPCICGYYGRACRQMNDKADRMLCTGCALAEFSK